MTYTINGTTFEWDVRTAAWLFGDLNHGIGVFKDRGGKWYGNIVLRGSGWVLAYGPWKTAEEGMIKLLRIWNCQEHDCRIVSNPHRYRSHPHFRNHNVTSVL